MDKKYFTHYPVDKKAIKAFLYNMFIEIDEGLFSEKEYRLLLDPKLYGKFLSNDNRNFFLYHFLPLWENSIYWIFHYYHHPIILDVGCGAGTSSIIYSILKANVLGVDLNSDLIKICSKRKKFYGLGKSGFDLHFVQSDVFDILNHDNTKYNIIFFLFSFNLIQPTVDLIEKINLRLESKGLLLIIDGNAHNISSKIIKSKKRPGVLKPKEMCNLLENFGMTIVDFKYQCLIPPVFHRNIIFRLFGDIYARLVEVLYLKKWLSASYTIVARKI